MNTTNASNANNANNASNATNALTQSELQSLKSLLKKQINEVNQDLDYHKEASKDVYQKANPDDELNGKFWFDCLNYCRDRSRKHKKQLKNLESLQKSVKRILSGR